MGRGLKRKAEIGKAERWPCRQVRSQAGVSLAGERHADVAGEFREVFEALCDDGIYDVPVDGMICVDGDIAEADGLL